MFFNLLKKECGMWTKNILLYIYIIMIFMFYTTQMTNENDIYKPVQNATGNYGYTLSNDETLIMNTAIENLVYEYSNNTFVTYPFMFYQEKSLSEKEAEAVGEILEALLGKSETQWELELNEYYNSFTETTDKESVITTTNQFENYPLIIDRSVEYSQFLMLMEQIESYVGNGSKYSLESIQQVSVSMTYKQAVDNYEVMVKAEGITSAYARLFCDYIGIILGIIPAFFAITRVYKDKRSQVFQIINTKKVSTFTLVTSKYLAMVIVTFVPVLLLSILPLIHSIFISNINGVQVQYFTFVIYCFGWLLPTILFVIAFAYFIACLFENMLSVLTSLMVWFGAIVSGAGNGLINASYNLIPRFNELGAYLKFENMLPQLIENRIIYVITSLLIVLFTIIVVSKKRVGGLQFNGKLPKHLKG